MKFFNALFLLFLITLCAGVCAAQTGTLTPVAVTASSISGSDTPAKAVDGNLNTVWSSGAFKPQWIQLNLGQQYTILKVRLNVLQSPSGRTRHEIYGGPTPATMNLLGVIDRTTQDRQWLEFETSASNVQYLRITTTESPSWVGWREIQVYRGGLQYYGYFGSAQSGVSNGNYTAEISDHSNVTWIWGDSAGHDALLTDAHNRGMGAVLDVSSVFFDQTYWTLLPNYQTNWDNYAAAIAGNIGSVVAFFPLDEPFTRGRPRDEMKLNLETISTTIKATFPGKPVAVIFAPTTVGDTANFVIPRGYDWVGFNCYPKTGGSFDNCDGHSIPWYVDTIKNKLTANQRMIMVPEGVYFGDVALSVARGFQSELIDRADRFHTLAQSDPLFVGLFTFIYQSQQEGDYQWWGTRDLPLVRAKYYEIGQSIINPTSFIIYPSAVSASNSTAGNPPAHVIDGDLSSDWGAGAFSPQWIQLDLGGRYAISKVRLNVSQSPTGRTRHEIRGGPLPTSMTLLGVLDSTTHDGQWLEFATTANIRYLKITTTDSPSWVSWCEIQVFR